MVRSVLNAQELDCIPAELSPFLTRCFIARVRCLLDNKSGFLVSRAVSFFSHVVTRYWYRSHFYATTCSVLSLPVRVDFCAAKQSNCLDTRKKNTMQCDSDRNQNQSLCLSFYFIYLL